MKTPQEVAADFAYMLASTGQVITVWADGTWKIWGAYDAFYAQTDPGYLATIPMNDLAGGEHCDDCEAMAAGSPYSKGNE